MLFLLNDRIVDVEAPEVHLSSRWKSIGCGEPFSLMARDAIEFVRAVVDEHRKQAMEIDTLLAQDLAALIIAKTGANAILFVRLEGKPSETRLTMIPENVLGALKERIDNGGRALDVAEVWPAAA